MKLLREIKSLQISNEWLENKLIDNNDNNLLNDTGTHN